MINIENSTIENFLEIIKNKKIICFCAGQKFIELCEVFNIESKVLYVVDNFKYGQILQVDRYNIPILSINEVGEEIKDCVLLISSTQYAVSIIQQLDSIDMFNSLTVFLPELFVREKTYNFNLQKEKIIPKTIHYCWFGKSDMPRHLKNNIETWKRNCPDYKIVRWDENNYDISKNKYMLQAYESQKWGFVSDYARLDVVYKNGGIYLDTDVEMLKSYDELLRYKMFCGFSSHKYVNFGVGFGAIKNNVIIGKILKEYDNLSFIKEDGSLDLTTCLIYQTKVMKEFGLILNGETQETDEFLALSSQYLSPINYLGFGSPTINSFSIHQYEASWCQEEKNKYLKDSKFIKSRLKNI